MEPWEEALSDFLIPWEAKPEVVGAIATGSYVVGTQSPFSDVDVHIVLDASVGWRERGNKLVDGLLIEYFANPPGQITKYMEADFEAGRRANARMFTTGKVVFDKTGIVEGLRAAAAEWMGRPFDRPSQAWCEQRKYALWDQLDTLCDLSARKSPAFQLVYHLGLQAAFETYARFLGAELAPPGKLQELMADPTFGTRYRMDPFPDPEFIALVGSCLTGRSLDAIADTIEHVQKAMGGFNIDGWVLRTPAER